MRRALLLLAAAALAACNTGFEPQYRVRDLRILAISSHASQGGTTSAAADVGLTDTLDLDVLVVDTLARPGFTIDWIACLPQPSDAIPPCLDQAYLQEPARLLGAAGTVPGVVSLGSGQAVSFPIPDVRAALAFAVEAAQANITFECRLYVELVAVAIVTAQGSTAMAYKRVPIVPTQAQVDQVVLAIGGKAVTQRYVLNLNPTIGEVKRDPSNSETCSGGIPVSTQPFPSGQTVICGLGTTDAAQTYDLCEPDGSVTPAQEQLDWQWYVTGGEFPDVGGVGDARGDHVTYQRPAGSFTLWSIVRDGRGGIDWAEFVYSTL